MSEHRSTEQKDIVRELYRTLYEEKSFDAVPEFYAPNAVRHGGLQGSIEARSALQSYLQASLGGLSNIEVTELHCLVENDLVAYDFEMAATHSGELLGVPAPRNRFEITNRINVEGTRNVLELMNEYDVTKGVYISTVGVYGNTDGGYVDESYRSPNEFPTVYQQTKWRAHY